MYRLSRLAKNNNHLRATKLLLSAFYRAHNLVKNTFLITLMSLFLIGGLQVTLVALNESDLTNLGLKKVKYIDELAKIRALSRVGIQYTSIFFKSNMSIMFDYILRNKDELVYSIGTTFRAHENFNIHLGTSDFSDLFGFSIGLGIKKGDLGINLSLKQQKKVSDIYRLSLSMEL
ncbi:hypothetical protein CL657_00120 [bacterium]|nr:hypothetical protein [bacterium]|tara:strand:+ start:53 stop:577 length:525 start_codon:yes stop_codon:yes gene_type:complete